MARLDRAVALMERDGLECALVSRPVNIYYLTGFLPHAPAFLVLGKGPVLLLTKMDSTREVPVEYQVVEKFKDAFRDIKAREIGVEKGHLTIAFKEKNLRGKKLADIGFVEEMRRVKGRGEIKEIEKAVETTEAVLSRVSLGGSEKEVALDIWTHFRKEADAAFEPIVASGARSAVPHHKSSDAPMEPPVIVDLGAKVDHYCADMTRTFLLDTDDILERYSVCLDAQEAGIKEVRAGNEIAAVDRAVRGVLAEHDLEDAFIHSSGHGIGLEVHEAPTLSKDAEGVFEEGMVVCVEPGVYRDFGIRIEDVVRVGKRPKVLTSFRK